MPRRTRCWRCQREVLWTVTETGRRLAVDPQPSQEGNTAVFRDGAGTYRSRRPTEELPAAPWERMYVPHVATCPKHAEEAPATPPVLPPGVADFTAYRRKAKGR
ncbi:hypothetical protein [Actinacidiphila acididurans]|uniref:Uncharacterized protein n=1 Tax=Actinacidiphila acididurans TaxID=2784346 RepID=A0ABS2TUR2_9ACTN|nr:hypothetical protein [Actinacidiphila acididurans]MBM9506731.1 hypothetical protein [Actinacidiphila acididurans]